MPRLGSRIDENTNFRLSNSIEIEALEIGSATYIEDLANSVEEPTMRINLLLILCFQNENDLNGHQIVRVVLSGKDKLRCGVN